jgi:hypothetical protein
LTNLFSSFEPVIRETTGRSDRNPADPRLRLWSERSARHQCFYAPFDYVNPIPRLILVGITPGPTQMNRALNAASHILSVGQSSAAALFEAKREGSFGGPLREDLVPMLDGLGVSKGLGISGAHELWTREGMRLAHFCSLLKYPVFENGKPYADSPLPHQNDLFNGLLRDFCDMVNRMPLDAFLLPLGSTVLESLVHLKSIGWLARELFGGRNPVALPHPSPQNKESILLALANPFPSREAYCDQRYRSYIAKKPENPQAESLYKAVRRARWDAIAAVRAVFERESIVGAS